MHMLLACHSRSPLGLGDRLISAPYDQPPLAASQPADRLRLPQAPAPEGSRPSQRYWGRPTVTATTAPTTTAPATNAPASLNPLA
jgi:hypothetical protein